MHAPATTLYARRLGRAAFGLVLTVGMLVTALVAFRAAAWPAFAPPPVWAGQSLLITWLCALGASRLVRSMAVGLASAGGARPLEAAGGGPTLPVACPTGVAEGPLRAAGLELAALALPLAGLSLALPLTLHAALAVLLRSDAVGFNGWVVVSTTLVGHAHLVLAALSVGYAGALCQRRPPPVTALGAVALTALAAAVPGLFFLGLPVLLTFLTGVAFVPTLYAWAARTVDEERAQLQA